LKGSRIMRSISLHAFTLIELLIVVVIIAILAAIAFPNMLEASVRARTARTHSDLRSLATGLESCRIDTNAYPRATLYMTLDRRISSLTTPIAYLSKLPEDPFHRQDAATLAGTSADYCYASGNIYFGTTNQFDSNTYINTVYSLAGRGPDGDINVGGYCMAHPVALRNETALKGMYDPTNGTISAGDILRLGGGTLGAAK